MALNLFKDKSRYSKYKDDMPLDTSGSKDIHHTTYGAAKWMGKNRRIPKNKISSSKGF
ncbi:MAG: hypothetical protein PHS46_08265 [Candidatus Omnitrophica bacterium]|nr:hypothetical protein [Candidatus Omnitrophota bacterium]